MNGAMNKKIFKMAMVGLAVTATLGTAAQASRVINENLTAFTISGARDDLSGNTYAQKSIKLSYEHDRDWTYSCGRYVARALLMRLGPRGGQNYTRDQVARIFGMIDEIEIRHVRGGMLGTPNASAMYRGGDNKLIVEFNTHDDQTGMAYCGLNPEGDTLRAIHQAWARYEVFSRRDEDADRGLSLGSAVAEGQRRPQVDHSAAESAFSRELQEIMGTVNSSAGGLPDTAAVSTERRAPERAAEPAAPAARTEERRVAPPVEADAAE